MVLHNLPPLATHLWQSLLRFLRGRTHSHSHVEIDEPVLFTLAQQSRTQHRALEILRCSSLQFICLLGWRQCQVGPQVMCLNIAHTHTNTLKHGFGIWLRSNIAHDIVSRIGADVSRLHRGQALHNLRQKQMPIYHSQTHALYYYERQTHVALTC